MAWRPLLAGAFLVGLVLSAPAQAQNLVLSATKLTVDEGSSATFTVRLDDQPSEAVTVTLSRTGSSDVTFDTDPTTDGNQDTLEFTTSNWFAAQAVTVTTDWNSDRTDDKATVNFTGNLINPASVGVAVLDDGDQVGVTGASQGGLVGITGWFPSGTRLIEGSTNTYNIKLRAQPGGTRTVTVSADNSDVTVDTNPEISGNQNTLTFTPSDWNQWQAVTLHVGHDSDKTDDKLIVLSQGTSLRGLKYHLGLIDDDVKLILSPASLTMNEGGTKTFEVKLDTQVKSYRIVRLSSTNFDVTVDTSTSTAGNQTVLSFNASNWNTGRTVTVRAAHDTDKLDETATISLTGNGVTAGSVNVTVIDDDKAELVLSPTSLTMNEGQSKTFSVKLNSRPSAGVTITLARTGSGDVTFDTNTSKSGKQNTLTFTTLNWSADQTVRVSAAEDADFVNDSATLSLTAAGGGYDAATASIAVTAIDPVIPILSIDQLPLADGTSSNITVKLSGQPSEEVTVTAARYHPASDPNVTFDTDANTPGDQSTLTFTPSNWSTAQTVKVTSAGDSNSYDSQTLIRFTLSGSNSRATLDVRVLETVGLTILPTSLALSEGSSTTFTVLLNVNLMYIYWERLMTLTSDNPDVTLDNTKLETHRIRNNWSTTSYTMTVRAAQDSDKTHDTATISLSGIGFESASVSVTVRDDDDDPVGLILSPTSLTMGEGGTGTFTVKLAAQTGIDRTVTLSSTNSDVTVDVDPDTTGSQTTLTFTADNWNTEHTVTVAAAHDADATDDKATINLEGAGVVDGAVDVTVTDDDIELELSATELTMDEGGTKTFTVRLAEQPGEDLTVSLSSSNPDVTMDVNTSTAGKQTALTFTAANWNTAQTVTVSAAHDADKTDDTATINLTGTGVTAGSVGVTVIDDDMGLTLSTSSLTIPEGGSKTFTVKLDTQPRGNRTVNLSSTNSDVTVDTDSDTTGNQTALTFTASNWSTAQEVRVSAAHDADKTDDSATVSLTGVSVIDGTVTVNVTDDDDVAVGLTLSPTSLTMNEGSTKTFTVKLTAQPGKDRTATLSSSNSDVTVDTDSGTTGNQTTLTFTTANWDSEQTVTVSAAHDADATDDKATINLTGVGVVDGSVDVTVTDDDIGLELSATELTMNEGGTETFTVRLAEQPGKALTVNLSPSNPDITVDANTSTAGKKTTLIFTTENWNSDQTVTLIAAHDDDLVDDTVTINLTGAGIASSSLQVSVIDDDLGLILSATSLRMREGSHAEFKVRLSKQPSFDVLVTLAQPSNTDVTVDTDRDTAGNQHTLHFTKSSWSTDQAVRVHASQDADSTDDTANISITASGGGYDAATGNVAVTVTDQDLLKIVSFTRQIMVEGGSSISFSFKMSAQPSESTTFTLGWLSNPDPNPGIAIDTDALTAGNQNTVTFTTSNWSTAHVVSLSAINDADSADEGGRLYAGLPNGGEIELRDFQVIDDDVEMILSATLMQLNEGGSGTFTVRMDGQGGTVRSIGLSSNNSAVTVSPKNLSFNSINWNAAQTVTVSAIQDSDRSNETATISLKNSWETMSGSVEVSAIDDDDSDVGLTLSRTSLTMDEDGTETFTVQLAAQPGNDRTVSLASTNPDVTIDTDAGTPGNQTELTFTPANWSTAQTVTLTAVEDSDSNNETAMINLSGNGIASASVSVSVNDND
ncbi:MAG: hypothetical protein ISN29_09505, partial [Gammaproteobacteria bacterium AqS3]|nr:hypothetical protein [Gammaproteobacteria bacterium AqS3]